MQAIVPSFGVCGLAATRHGSPVCTVFSRPSGAERILFRIFHVWYKSLKLNIFTPTRSQLCLSRLHVRDPAFLRWYSFAARVLPQARGERATIRHHLLLDPLINPPADLKVRMCREYLKQVARRHAGAVGEFHEKARRAADTQIKAIKVSHTMYRNQALVSSAPIDSAVKDPFQHALIETKRTRGPRSFVLAPAC